MKRKPALPRFGGQVMDEHFTGSFTRMQVTSIDTTEDAQVKICRNKKTGDFAIVHQCRHKWPFSAVEVGNVERVGGVAFEADGFEIVVRSLREYPKRQKSNPSELESLPEPEQRRFDAEHRQVRVAVIEDGLTLEPFKSGSPGGYGASDALGKKLRFPVDAKTFHTVLKQVFERAD